MCLPLTRCANDLIVIKKHKIYFEAKSHYSKPSKLLHCLLSTYYCHTTKIIIFNFLHYSLDRVDQPDSTNSTYISRVIWR